MSDTRGGWHGNTYWVICGDTAKDLWMLGVIHVEPIVDLVIDPCVVHMAVTADLRERCEEGEE